MSTAAPNLFSMIGMVYCSDSEDLTIATPGNTLATLLDFRSTGPKTFRKYIKVSKYFSKRGQKWLKTNGGIGVCE